MPNCKDCHHSSCKRIGCDISGGCPSYTPDWSEAANYYKNKLYIRDADEFEGHLCNSLNVEESMLFRCALECGKDGSYILHKKRLETLGYYFERAQAVIWYLRDEVEKLKEENKMTNYNEVRKFLDEVPTDIAGRITEEFFGWPKGTNKVDIEKWFDKKARGESTRIHVDAHNDVLIKITDRYS